MEGWQTQVLASSTVDVGQSYALTVLLPAYDEERAITNVLTEVVEALTDEPYRYEIVVVDDASTDATARLAEEFAADCWQCSVRVLRRHERGGAGAARKTGIRAARGDVVVMLDADGTYPARMIPVLMRYFPDFDQVNGARTSEQGTLPWLRMPAKWFIRRLASYLTGYSIPDLNTGLKAFRRDVMLDWLWVVPDGFSCVTTMTLAFLTNGRAVKYVPTDYRKRIGASKFHPVTDTLAYLNTVLRIVLYFRPLKIFLPLAGILAVGGVAKTCYSVTTTGGMQESDVVVLMTSVMTAVSGLLAEVMVAHHRR